MPKQLKKNNYCYENNGRICRVFFSNEGSFIVDADDAEHVLQKYWSLGKRGYPVFKTSRSSPNGARNIPLHRYLLGFPPAGDIDHINGDRMDNRRCNLRLCTHQQNTFNQRKRKTNTSGYIGVSFAKNMDMFEAYIHCNGRKRSLGHYKTAIEAASVRDKAAKEYFGEYARLNLSA